MLNGKAVRALAEFLYIPPLSVKMISYLLGVEKPVTMREIAKALDVTVLEARKAAIPLRRSRALSRDILRQGLLVTYYYTLEKDAWILFLTLLDYNRIRRIEQAATLSDSMQFVDFFSQLSEVITNWIDVNNFVRSFMADVLDEPLTPAIQRKLAKSVTVILRYLNKPDTVQLLTDKIVSTAEQLEADNIEFPWYLYRKVGDKILLIDEIFDCREAYLICRSNSDFVDGVTDDLTQFEVMKEMTCEVFLTTYKRVISDNARKLERLSYYRHRKICQSCKNVEVAACADLLGLKYK